MKASDIQEVGFLLHEIEKTQKAIEATCVAGNLIVYYEQSEGRRQSIKLAGNKGSYDSILDTSELDDAVKILIVSRLNRKVSELKQAAINLGVSFDDEADNGQD